MKHTLFIIALLLISCQQGAKDKNTIGTELQQVEAFEKHIDTLETNHTPIQVNSPLRPNELLFLNTTYTDTLEFIDYNDDYDYRYLIGNKNDKEVSLASNWDWFDNE